MQRFSDRREAGRQLAGALRHLKGPELVVVGLPRGGVVVAAEVADALDAPLDVFVVRKLGVPGQEELAFGAIASGGIRVLVPDVVAAVGLRDEDIARVAAAEQQELQRRERAFRRGSVAVPLRGRVVVVVDDGVATGATMRAALAAIASLGARKVVAAIPVGAPDTVDALRGLADEVVCLARPEPFMAVGIWYDDFRQTTDDEVVELLARAAGRQAGPAG